MYAPVNTRVRVTARHGRVCTAFLLLATVFSPAPTDAAVRTWNSQRGTWANTGNRPGGTVPTSRRISNASFTCSVADAGGTVSYEGNSYSLLPGTILVTPTTAATANFSGGTATNGQITTSVVVPEPTTAIFAGIGILMLGWTLWKRRRLAALARGRRKVGGSGGPSPPEHRHERP